jgi:anti-anti-sigma factor
MEVPSSTVGHTPDSCPVCGHVLIVEPTSVPAKDAPCPQCGRVLWFVRKTVGDAVILTFLPGLMVGSESLERINEVSSAIGDFPRVVLNLSHLHFVASMFLGMLIVLHKRAVSAKGKLKICGVQPEVLAVFKATQLDSVLAICQDERSALESF